jgi:multiple sugar transport system permease protein
MNAKAAARAQGRPVLERFSLPLRILGYATVIALGLLYLFPFILQLVTGFKTDPDAAAHPLGLIPTTPTTAAYQRLFGLSQSGEAVPFFRWLGNSVFLSVTVTAGRVLFDSMAGYALARLNFPGRRLLFGFVIAILAVPPVALLIPKFLVLNTFGLFDTYTAMILPLLVDTVGIFIMKQFFESIPREVEEAAKLDGAGVFRTFW